MAETAKKITNLRPPEQDLGQNDPSEPWLRQKNEPAVWYMRFKRYLDMGSKRSLRAVLADEAGTQVNTKEGKKLSDVSVPRPWRRASKLWRWVERAAAYDLAQVEKQAVRIREMAGTVPHASKAYRIMQLDYLARLLKDNIKPGIELRWCLALTARYQSVMSDLAREMEGIDEETLQMCDASAMHSVLKEVVEKHYAEKMKSATTHERNKLALERADKLAKLEKQKPL
jgi:hypothetical protein